MPAVREIEAERTPHSTLLCEAANCRVVLSTSDCHNSEIHSTLGS